MKVSTSLQARLVTALACLVIAAAALTGCRAPGEQPSAERTLAAQLVVRQATLRYIEAAPVPAARAAAVHAVVGRVLAVAEADETTLSALEVSARALVPWDALSPADRDLLDLLITAISQRLTERIGEGVLDPEDRVAVIEVLHWVQAAASLYQRAG